MSWIKIDFFGMRLRSWSFRFFCVTFFLLAYLSMHCEFLLREFCKPRWISTLNQKYLFVITSLTTTQFEYGLSFRWNQKNQGHHIKKSFGRQGSTKKKVNLRYLPYLVGSPTIHTRGRSFVQAWGDGWVSILCYQKF